MTSDSTQKHSGERPRYQSDYHRVARAIEYLDEKRHERPSLRATADHVGLSPHHFQRMFRRWCGVMPRLVLSPRWRFARQHREPWHGLGMCEMSRN